MSETLLGLEREPLDATLTALAETDLAELEPDELLQVIGELDRLRSRVHGITDNALAAWARLTTPPVGFSGQAEADHRWSTDELGLTLGVAAPTASVRMHRALTLDERLPFTAALLRAGFIGTAHAERLAAAAARVDPLVSQDAELVVHGLDADWRTPRQAEAAYTAAVLALDPDGAADRARRAARDSGVRLRPEPDGMSTFTAFLPAADGAAVTAAVDAHARSSLATNNPGDHRALDERRAAALVDLVCGPADHPEAPDDPTAPTAPAPTRHGRTTTVHVTVAWTTLLGLDDLPADLTGYGPIDAATARRIAADPTSTWRRLLVEPLTGRLLDHGRATYRPPQDLVDFVIARDASCRFPGCEQPAVVCDIDHRTPYGAESGPTSAGNLDPLCRHHHRLKHEHGWTHHRDPDTGESLWTTPSGRTTYGRSAHALPIGTPISPPDVTTGPEPPDPDPGPPPF